LEVAELVVVVALLLRDNLLKAAVEAAVLSQRSYFLLLH
jgi:hypothetical protein